MRRRSLLGTAATSLPLSVAVAGCLGQTTQTGGARAPRVTLRMESVSDAEVAERTVHGLEDGPDERRAVLSTVLRDGSATTRGFDPAFRDGDIVVYDGGVYRVGVEPTDTERVFVYSITLNDLGYDTVTTVAGDESVRFSDLPAVDRTVFERNGLADGEVMGIGTTFVYAPAEAERSALVPDPAYRVIVWGPDREGRFTVDDSYDRTRTTYEYTAETVADSAAVYGRSLRREYGFELAGLSAAEQTVVETAIEEEDGFTVPPDGTVPEGVSSLAERFRPQVDPAAVEGTDDSRGEVTGSYVVRYEGAVYWATFLYREADTTAG